MKIRNSKSKKKIKNKIVSSIDVVEQGYFAQSPSIDEGRTKVQNRECAWGWWGLAEGVFLVGLMSINVCLLCY